MKKLTCLLVVFCLLAGRANAELIFTDDFDGGQVFAPGVAGGFSGAGSPQDGQGYIGRGSPSNMFAGNLLRNTTSSPVQATILTLNDLPTHTSVSLGFLLAIIDSWDGERGDEYSPDFFNVTLDGTSIFSESFENSGSTAQSYVAPPGGLIVDDEPLGFTFGAFNNEDGYDMGVDPMFIDIPHTADTLEIQWFTSGAGWQGSTSDESWAIDNVQVSVLNAVPEPSSFLCVALLTIGVAVSRRSVHVVVDIDR